MKGGPSLWERVRVRGFVPTPTGSLTPALWERELRLTWASGALPHSRCG